MIDIQRSTADKKRFVIFIGDFIYHISLKEARKLRNKLNRFKEFK